MLYVLSFGLIQGQKGGVAAAIGVALGMLAHTCLAALGVSALLKAASWPIEILRVVGAVYLLYLGVQMIRSSNSTLEIIDNQDMKPLWRIVVNSSVVNITNPKILIFYLTFLPQFVSGDEVSFGLQMFTLGIIFSLMGFVIDASIGISSGFLSHKLLGSDFAMKLIGITGGAILIILAGALAFMSL